MQKIYAQKWKQKFEGGFLKGAFWRAIHDANLAVTLICTWRVDTTPAIWFFTMEKKYFLKLLSVLTWVLTNFNAETEGYIPNCLRPHHFFKGFITSKLTRIFVNFRVIHVLLSLILFYQKYSRLRCLLRVKGLVIGFYLVWQYSSPHKTYT